VELKSLGFKSEQIFTSFDGLVETRGSYQVVRTPSNPNFFWGNLLIFDRAPKRGDLKSWVSLFKKEFPDPRIYHVTCAWDVPDVGDVSEFLEQGYDFQPQAVLSATAVVKPPRFSMDLEVRCLSGDREWADLIELQVASAHDNMPPGEWRKFYVSQAPRYRAMVAAGLGDWYGGFFEGRLVCALGLFHRDGLGRFQIVCTHPDFQRRGFAGTIVSAAAMRAFKELGLRELVMCADPDYHAIRIYESVGFVQRETEYGVYWWNRNEPR
jgi:GNAT superfamily N-acetyltransferase